MEFKKVDYIESFPVGTVKIDDPFWNRYCSHLQQNMVPHMWSKNYGVVDIFKMAAGDLPVEELPTTGREQWKGLGWDLGPTQWMEGAVYTLAHKDNPDIRKWVDEVADLVSRMQDDEGYLYSYFLMRRKDQRLKNLLQSHELVAMGGAIEAAVVYYQVTGKRNMLDAACKLADYLYKEIGPGSPRPYLYGGHAGMEMGLVRLYRCTGNPKHLELAKHMLDVRGQDPDILRKQMQEEWKLDDIFPDWEDFGGHKYIQSHAPTSEQDTAEGHAVRATYLYTGMVDVYMETGDESLLRACEKIFDNIVGKRIYISGGVGSVKSGERFSADYDLPTSTMYCESCAAVGMTLFCRRLFQATGDSKYLDALEREFYNAVPGGTSLDGKHFFYVNPLDVWPTACEADITKRHILPERQEWLEVACCPPNLQRALAGLDGYMYYAKNDVLYVGLFISGETEMTIAGKPLKMKVETRYPFEKEVLFHVDYNGEFALALRKPAWADGVAIKVNSEAFDADCDKGMLMVRRVWKPGDVVSYTIEMTPKLMASHPQVRANAGRGAVMRGPLLYCLEEIDNGDNLSAITLKSDVAFEEVYEPELLGGTLTLHFKGLKMLNDGWGENELYKPFVRNEKEIDLKAIPYCLWQNRGKGELQTWIPVR